MTETTTKTEEEKNVLPHPKRLASIVRQVKKSVEAGGGKASDAQVRSGLAKAYGFKNWNTLLALAEQQHQGAAMKKASPAPDFSFDLREIRELLGNSDEIQKFFAELLTEEFGSSWWGNDDNAAIELTELDVDCANELVAACLALTPKKALYTRWPAFMRNFKSACACLESLADTGSTTPAAVLQKLQELNWAHYELQAATIGCDHNTFQCDNCGWSTTDEDALNVVQDLEERVLPGEPMPAGECPLCGAVCHLIDDEARLDQEAKARAALLESRGEAQQESGEEPAAALGRIASKAGVIPQRIDLLDGMIRIWMPSVATAGAMKERLEEEGWSVNPEPESDDIVEVFTPAAGAGEDDDPDTILKRIYRYYGTEDHERIYLEAAGLRSGSPHEETPLPSGKTICAVCGDLDLVKGDPIYHPEQYL